MSNIHRVIIPMIVLFTGILLQKHFPSFFKDYLKTKQSESGEQSAPDPTTFSEWSTPFTSKTLANYNGITEKKLYMAVLGIVYDVSDGPQHYAKGSPYHYFVGKDGTRALITGDFKDESEHKDHVLDLQCSDFLNLLDWRETLEKKYKSIGILAGRYYDSNGESTAYSLEVIQRFEECFIEKEFGRKHDLMYPPCNMAWSEEEGTKVWCTKSSGGISRSWVGVPRQLFTPGEKRPKCVCMKTDEEQDKSKKFKEYKNCANTSVICFVDSG